jgi:hypothetical protein
MKKNIHPSPQCGFAAPETVEGAAAVQSCVAGMSPQ